MVTVRSVLVSYRRTAERHSAIAVLLVVLGMTILVTAVARGRGVQAVVYFSALTLSVLAIDTVFAFWPVRVAATPVRHPRAEPLVALLSFVVAIAWLFSRFVYTYTIPSLILRLAAVSAVFNIPLVLVLLILRYRLKELGILLRGFAPVPLVILCFGVLAAVFSPSSLTMKGASDEAGSIWGLLLIAFGEAAFPEEFFRFVWQTRVSAFLDNRAVGWLIASVLWAALHIPKEYGDSHSIAGTLAYTASIIPLGLLWGYLTMRTGSIVPSVALHGTNFWGLQNL